MTLLNPGDRFPDIELTRPGGETLQLPDALAGGYGVVLFYSRRLVSVLQRVAPRLPASNERLADAGVRVVALSVDDEATTRETIEKHGIEFRVGYGADAHALAAATGAFVNEDPVYVQSPGFVLDPDGRTVVSVYSIGAIGRLVPEDVVGLVRFEREHAVVT